VDAGTPGTAARVVAVAWQQWQGHGWGWLARTPTQPQPQLQCLQSAAVRSHLAFIWQQHWLSWKLCSLPFAVRCCMIHRVTHNDSKTCTHYSSSSPDLLITSTLLLVTSVLSQCILLLLLLKDTATMFYHCCCRMQSQKYPGAACSRYSAAQQLA